MLYKLTEGNLRPPASCEAIHALSSQLGALLPSDYFDFLAKHNGGEGFIGSNFVIFWKADEILVFNREYEVEKYVPGLVLFGSNGGGDAYGFDTASRGTPIVCVPLIGMAREYADTMALNFNDFFTDLART